MLDTDQGYEEPCVSCGHLLWFEESPNSEPVICDVCLTEAIGRDYDSRREECGGDR